MIMVTVEEKNRVLRMLINQRVGQLFTIMLSEKRDHTSSGNAWGFLRSRSCTRVHEDHIVLLLTTAEDPVW